LLQHILCLNSRVGHLGLSSQPPTPTHR
jgi:hypothetical protein